MIFPFDAAYAQEVLRKHYEYAEMLRSPRDKLAAKVNGLVNHDRLLARWDSDASKAHIRRIAIERYGYVTRNPA